MLFSSLSCIPELKTEKEKNGIAKRIRKRIEEDRKRTSILFPILFQSVCYPFSILCSFRLLSLFYHFAILFLSVSYPFAIPSFFYPFAILSHRISAMVKSRFIYLLFLFSLSPLRGILYCLIS